MVNANGTGAMRLGRREDFGSYWTLYPAWTPVWSPDGNLLAFTGPNNGYQSALFVMPPVDGYGAVQLFVDDAEHFIGSVDDWSPDRRWIAITRAPKDQRAWRPDVYLIAVDGTAGMVRVTSDGKASSAAFLRD